MADKSIVELPESSALTDDGLLVVYQNNTTNKIRGQLVRQFVENASSEYVEAAIDAANRAESAKDNAETDAKNAAQSALTAQQYSGNPPKPLNGNWWIWNAQTQQYEDSGIKSVLSIVKSYPSVSDMEADVGNMQEGDLVIIATEDISDPDNSKLYVHNGSAWVFLSDLSGIEGVGIASIEQTGGDHSPGTTDVYTIILTNGSRYQISVYNGADGQGVGDFKADGSVPMAGSLQMGGNVVTNIGEPTNETDAVRKVDLDKKQDTISGTEGQIVTFDASGGVIAQDKGAPGGVASLDDAGQLPYAQAPHLTANVALYVSPTGSDSNPGTQSAPFATVQAAVDSIPKDLGSKIALLKIIGDVADSTAIMISDFYGGAIQLAGEPGVTHCSVPVEAYYCTSLTFYGMTFDTPSSADSMMLLADCAKVGVSSCTFEGTDKSKTGILCANQTNLGVSSCTFNNLNYAIDTNSSSGTRGAATVSVYDCSGSGNSVAVNCTTSAICVEYYRPLSNIGADTTVVQSYGGIVFNQNGTLYTG